MKQNQLYLINQLRSRIKKLEKLVQDYKEKCNEIEKRVKALEDE